MISKLCCFVRSYLLCSLLLVALLVCNATVNVYAEDLDGYFVTLVRLNLRAEPSTEAEILTTASLGASVDLEYLENDWYKVIYKGIHGYMKAEFIGKAEELASSTSSNVELLSWSDAKHVFTPGVPAEIFDVRTGLTYFVKSFSNGNHADVEPITKEDTSIMLKTYSGKWNWSTRPILVTINGRTLAASINGMPHGGGINNNNDMNGQVCIHFKDSKTHNGNKSHERDHQNSVMEAYTSM